MTDPSTDYAALIRTVLMKSMNFTDGSFYTHDEYDAAMAALNTLLSRVASLEAELAEARKESWQEVAEVYKTSTAAYRRDADEAQGRAERAEAALREIAVPSFDYPSSRPQAIARAALAASPSSGETE